MSEECKKCRICLESTSKDVVPLHLLVEVEKSYADIYEYLSGLIPNKGSQYLCYACREELLKAYEFKKKIQDCEKIWSVDIKIENDIPIEVAEIDIKPDTEALVFVSTLIPEIESEIPEGKTETRTRSKFHDDFQWPEISDAESDKNESQNAIESCPYCEATYKTHNRLYKHYYKTHKGHKLKCVDCNKEFLFFDPFVKHRRKKHQSSDIKRKFEIIYPTLSEDSKNAKTFECPFCPEVFNVKNRLTHHKKQQHPGMKLPKKDHNEQTICPECGIMIFVRALERHQRTAHNATPRETYICDLCGAKLVSKVGMGIHMQLKHLHTTFFCRHCTENFPTPGIRRTHEIRFHTKNYKHCCHLCDKKFITGVHLRKHINTHTKEKQFPCEVCGMRLSTKDGLKRHLSTHSDERPHACEICGLGFKTAHVMRMHMKSHREWDYECPVCAQKFLVNQALRIHVTRNHPEYQLPPPGTVMNKSAIRKMEEIKAKYGMEDVTVAMLGTNRGNRRNPPVNQGKLQ